jgi:ABC-type transport system involved in multi-copper enzyme maturation permease subunit
MALGLIDAFWSIFGLYITIVLYLFSIDVILTIIFVQKKRPETVMVWVIACLAFPLIFVLLFYVFLGRDYKRKKMFGNKAEMDREVGKALFKTKGTLFASDLSKPGLGQNESLARMLFESGRSYLTNDQGHTRGDKGGQALHSYGILHDSQ